MSDIAVISVFLVCIIIWIPIIYMIGELEEMIGQNKNKKDSKNDNKDKTM